MLLLPYQALLFTVIQALYTYSEVSGERKLITAVDWKCFPNETVMVWISRIDHARLNLTTELRLLRSGSADCQPVDDGANKTWTFRAGRCGTQVVNTGRHRIVTNVLGVQERKKPSWSRVVACCYLRGRIVLRPQLDWNFYQRNSEVVKSAKYFSNSWSRIGKASPDVAQVDAYKWIYAVIQPVQRSFLSKEYDGEIKVTLDSCTLGFQFMNGTKDSRTLFREGCPSSSYCRFEKLSDDYEISSKGIVFAFSLERERNSNLFSVQLSCNVTLCVSEKTYLFKRWKYPNVPRCQVYKGLDDTTEDDYQCYYSFELRSINPRLTQTLTSSIFQLGQHLRPNTTSITATSNGTVTLSTPTKLTGPTASNRNEPTDDDDDVGTQADTSIALSTHTAVVVCLACTLCGATIVGVCWVLHNHRAKAAKLPTTSSSDFSIEKGSQSYECEEPCKETMASPQQSPPGSS